MKERVFHEIEFIGDRLEVGKDLVPKRVSVLRDVVEFLQHRQVDVGLDVAHQAGISVPVPGPADSACLIDDPDPANPPLAQLGRCHDSSHPTTDDHDIDGLGQGITVPVLGKWITPVARRVGLGAEIKELGSTVDEALVSLLQVLRAHRFRARPVR